MRAVVVRPGPAFSVADVCRGWVLGLRACGVETLDFNFDDRLDFYAKHPDLEKTEDVARMAAKGIEVACFEADVDVVVIISGFHVPPYTYDILRERGVKVVLVHTESPYEDDVQVMRAQRADLNIVNDPTNLAAFPPDSMYLPHCYDPDLHKPGPVDPDIASDFCFVGTGFPSRIEFFSAVDFYGIHAAFAGYWADDNGTPFLPHVVHDAARCIDNSDTIRLYNSTKVSANLYRKEARKDSTADGWAMGPREVELAASGTFFLREPRPEGDELFPMLPTFTDPGDFGEKLRWWLAHEDAREAAAIKAREAVADRTFPVNAARALQALGF